MGIMHRDIKPENLLFSIKDSNQGIIKISDFGLARYCKEDAFATTTCGTPGYVAPEILQELPYKESCDYWSMGVVLYILLCGEPPFYDDDNFELFEKIKRCDYKFDQPIWDYISDEAKDLIRNLLIVEPGKRFTASQVQNHPWITNSFKTKVSSTNVLTAMREWDTKRKNEALASRMKMMNDGVDVEQDS